MKSSKLYKSILALAAPFLLAACSSEEGVDTPVVEQEVEGIELTIPYSALKTRADEAATTDEAKIDKLYVVAYPNGNDGVFSYDPNGTSITDGHIVEVNGTTTYATVNVALKPGHYNIYVFANVSPSDLKKADGTTALTINASSEADLKTATFGDQSPIAKSDISSSYIPMSCMAGDLKKGAELNAESYGNTYNVEIKKGKATAVYAKLTFCYSKVRFTLLNGVSADVPTPTLKLKNSAKKLGLLSGLKYNTSTDLQDVTLAATKYACPANVPDNATALQTFSVDNLTTHNGTDKSWAYQGEWYIPERLYPDSPTKSQFDFNFGTGNEAYNTAVDINEFERGKKYDFVAYIQNKIVYVEVRVNNWEYHKAPVIDLE